MGDPLRVLIVEDSADDAELLLRELRKGGFDPVAERVETEPAFREALGRAPWDLVLADYQLPSFSAPAALAAMQSLGIDLPFIIASGVIGEDTAVACLRAGAHDFVLKGNLARLVPAVRRELREVEVRRERSRTVEALRAADASYRQIVETAAEGIWILAKDGTISFANERAGQLLGVAASALIGRPIAGLVHPESAAALAATLDASGTGGQRSIMLCREDGSELWVLVSSSPIRNTAGELTGVLEMVTDITELRRAEEALRRNERFFRVLTEAGTDLISVIDAGGTIRYASSSHERVLGLTSEQLVGTRAVDLLHPDDVSTAVRLMNEGFMESEAQRAGRFRCRHKDGSWRVVQVVGRNLLHDPVVNGAVLNAHDVTEQESLELQLRQSQKMEAVGRLAGGVAHDFNNLLTVIGSYSDLLLERAAEGGGRDELLEIRRATTSATDLTRQLLTFSRKQAFAPQVLDLNETVSKVEKMLRRLLGADTKLETRLAATVNPVLADPGQIEQVIVNLSVNGGDAMPDGGTLAIETANVELHSAIVDANPPLAPGSYVRLTVGDTGVGMTPEIREHLFEPFFTTKERGKGTGLGLSTVYGIVTQSQGHIVVRSAPRQGTKMEVYLPVVGASASEPASRSETRMVPTGWETVLIAEDSPPVLQIATDILERAKYEVIGAGDGAEAIAKARAHSGPIRLLVADVVMPGMNGGELAKLLSRLHPEMRVLYISGNMDDSIRQKSIERQPGAFLQKPFTPESLCQKVREVLDAPGRENGALVGARGASSTPT